MNKDENVSRICAELPSNTLSDDDIDNMRIGVRISIDFEKFISSISSGENVEPDLGRVRRLISEGLERLNRTRSIAGDCLSTLKMSRYERVEYANESTVAGVEFFDKIGQIASDIAKDMHPIPLRWKVYPGILELRAEYLAHMETLRAIDTAAKYRVDALMNAIRLQLLFLANTFW